MARLAVAGKLVQILYINVCRPVVPFHLGDEVSAACAADAEICMTEVREDVTNGTKSYYVSVLLSGIVSHELCICFL